MAVVTHAHRLRRRGQRHHVVAAGVAVNLATFAAVMLRGAREEDSVRSIATIVVTAITLLLFKNFTKYN